MEKVIRRYLLSLCLAFAVAGAPLHAQAKDNKEYQIKAAFIYNFVKFVEWPNSKAVSNLSSIDICVLGESPLSATGSVFKAASTAKLQLSLMEERSWLDAAQHCHIVFIGNVGQERHAEIIEGLRGKPVLTVSDSERFAEQGGMIGFVTHENKIKIVVNTKAVSTSGMRIDAQLLEIALKVIDK